MDRSNLATGGLAIAAIVLVPGLAKYALTVAGYNVVGDIVWIVGYGVGALVLWFLWIRPLDLTGPRGSDRPDAPNTGEEK